MVVDIEDEEVRVKPQGTAGTEVTVTKLWDQGKVEQNLVIPEFNLIKEAELGHG
jgi:hypothetical protein